MLSSTLVCTILMFHAVTLGQQIESSGECEYEVVEGKQHELFSQAFEVDLKVLAFKHAEGSLETCLLACDSHPKCRAAEFNSQYGDACYLLNTDDTNTGFKSHATISTFKRLDADCGTINAHCASRMEPRGSSLEGTFLKELPLKLAACEVACSEEDECLALEYASSKCRLFKAPLIANADGGANVWLFHKRDCPVCPLSLPEGQRLSTGLSTIMSAKHGSLECPMGQPATLIHCSEVAFSNAKELFVTLHEGLYGESEYISASTFDLGISTEGMGDCLSACMALDDCWGVNRNIRRVYSMTGVFVAVCFFYAWLRNKRNPSESETPIHSNHSSIQDDNLLMLRLEKHRSCLLNRLRTEQGHWFTFANLVSSCRNAATVPPPQLLKLGKHGDKLFLPYKDSTNPDCVFVSLGIGGEVDSEVSFKNLYPTCRFYGADAMERTAKAFGKMGKYKVATLEADDGPRRLYLLNGGRYKWTNVSNAVTLTEYFSDFVKEPIIHFLSMDIEGSEHRIIPAYPWKNQTPLICQRSAGVCLAGGWGYLTGLESKAAAVAYSVNSPPKNVKMLTPQELPYLLDYCKFLLFND